MSHRPRRAFSPDQKAAALRRRHIDKVPISQLCEKLDLQPSIFYASQRRRPLRIRPISPLGNPRARYAVRIGSGESRRANRGGRIAHGESQVVVRLFSRENNHGPRGAAAQADGTVRTATLARLGQPVLPVRSRISRTTLGQTTGPRDRTRGSCPISPVLACLPEGSTVGPGMKGPIRKEHRDRMARWRPRPKIRGRTAA